MKLNASLGWGIVIYALMYLSWSALAIHGVGGIEARIVQLLVLIVSTVFAARTLRVSVWSDVLAYSLVWVFEIFLLDIVFAVPYGGWAVFADWNMWVGYVLVALIPLIAPHTTAAPRDVPFMT